MRGRLNPSLSAALFAIALWSACASRGLSARAALEAEIQRYSRMVLAMDHAGIAALFSPDGELMRPGQPPLLGPSEVQAFLESFSRYKVLSYSIAPSLTVVHGDSASQEGSFHQQVRTPDGHVVDVSGRFHLDWIRESSGRWLIQRMVTSD